MTIRDAQLQAIEHGRVKSFEDQLAAALRRGHASAAGDLPDGYVEAVVAASSAACRARGHAGQATLADFADSMLKDDPHPMSAERMNEKVEQLLRDLDASARFARLEALRAQNPTQNRTTGG